jgi:hypothetical protein
MHTSYLSGLLIFAPRLCAEVCCVQSSYTKRARSGGTSHSFVAYSSSGMQKR